MSQPILKPGPERGQKRQRSEVCILCNKECDENHSDYPIALWNSLKDKALEWSGLDKYGDVHDNINWTDGPAGVYFHKTCKIELASNRKLHQALSRKKKQNIEVAPNPSNISADVDSSASTSSSRLSRSISGQLHEKELCIWCMKGEDKKHPSRDQLCLLQQRDAWCTFKSHTVYLSDSNMRDRILTVIQATDDPFALEIRYHRSCWKKYISPLYHPAEVLDSQFHLQNVRRAEVRQMLFKHVESTILQLNEPRTLQGLLLDYQNMMRNFGFDASSTESGTIKEMINDEFKDRIGFHDRYQKNKSTIVYDTSAGGDFIEAAIYSWGISDEQILNTVARRLKAKMLDDDSMHWPPSVEDLEKVEEPYLLLRQILSWLKNPSETDFAESCPDPEIVALSSLLLSLITGKRTLLKTQLTVTLHGLTRSREIVDLLKKMSFGISYHDLMNLYASWAKYDIEKNSICPDELAEGVPGTGILDNDDFREDTLTGGNTSHRTNVMFVQPENIVAQSNDSTDITLCKSKDLKTLALEQHLVEPYKTVKRGAPAVRTEVDTTLSNTNDQRKKVSFMV